MGWFILKPFKKYNFITFGFFWYLVGHSLESTFLPLELYFEHRNYLPSLGLFISISYGILILFDKFTYHGNRIKILFVLLFAIHIFTTLKEIDLWSNPRLQKLVWAENHPDSYRANRNLVVLFFEERDPRVFEVLDNFVNKWPEDFQARVDELSINCMLGGRQADYTSGKPSGVNNFVRIMIIDKYYSLFDSKDSCKVRIDNGLFVLSKWLLKQNISEYDEKRIMKILGQLESKDAI